MKQSRASITVPPRILLTRPAHQAEAFATALAAAYGGPLPIVIVPLMAILPHEPEEPVGKPDNVIFTSANAVDQVDRLAVPKTAKAWCVGDQTAAAASALGFTVHNAQGNADKLAAQIIASRPSGTFLHLHGAHVTGNVIHQLQEAGLPCRAAIVYAQKPIAPSTVLTDMMQGSDPVIVPLFSPRSARLLLEHAPFVAPLHIVAMSDAVAAAAESRAPAHVVTVEIPDKDHMIDATLQVYRALSSQNTP